MGIRGLLSYCSPIQTRLRISDASPKPLSIGIDSYSLFYSFKHKTDRAQQFLEELLRAGHSLTMVIDRRAAAEKQETVRRRQTERNAAATVVESLSTLTKCEEYEDLTPEQKRAVEQVLAWKKIDSWHMTPAVLHWYKVTCECLGITVEYAEEEADYTLAKGVKEGRWSAVVSGDSDLLLLRVPRLWLLSAATPTTVKEVRIEDVYRFTGLNADQLCQLAVLAGSDLSPRVLLPIANAVSWLRYYGSLAVIHARFPEQVTEEDLKTWLRIEPLYRL
jgi:hypothetical protein